MYYKPHNPPHPADICFSRRLTVVYDTLYYGCQTLIDYIEKTYSELHGGKALSIDSKELVFHHLGGYAPDCALLILCDHSYCNGRPVIAETVAGTLYSISKKNKVIVFVDSTSDCLTDRLIKQHPAGRLPIISVRSTTERLKGEEFDKLMKIVFDKTALPQTAEEKKRDRDTLRQIRDFVIHSPISVERYKTIVAGAELQRQLGLLDYDDFIDQIRKHYGFSLTEADF